MWIFKDLYLDLISKLKKPAVNFVGCNSGLRLKSIFVSTLRN